MTTYVAVQSGWAPNSADFPVKGDVEQMVRFCLRYAILAPSSHNSQPWWFKIDDNAVTIGLDVSRGLAVVDPRDREGIMSVGAAVFTLRVALAHFGLSCRINRWPDPLDPEACAQLVADVGGPVETELDELFEAISTRRTSRESFEEHPVEDALLEAIRADVAAEGAVATVFTGVADRANLASIVSQADQIQMSNPSFRRELAAWLRHLGSRRHDGIHGISLQSPLDQVLAASPILVRTFDSGVRRGARDSELIAGSPAMIVISTTGDEPDAWLSTGQALARAMLRATATGLSVGFLNQAIEVADCRSAVAAILPDGAVPQLLLRTGSGSEVTAQPRRPLDDFLVD